MSTRESAERSEQRSSNDETRAESREPRAEPERCPECDGGLTTDHQHGETSCADCGLVVTDDELDRGPEWRDFNENERTRRSRVGPPTTKTRHDDGLSTTIDWRNRDAKGNTLDSSQRQKMQRLRRWNERFRTQDAKERGLKHALGEIDRMGSALGLPEHVRETASVIHRRAVAEDLLLGRSIESVSSACLYAAARQSDLPRSLEEVTAVSRVGRKEIARSYRQVARELGLEVEPADPEDYLGRFTSRLDLDSDVEGRARELLDAARADGVSAGKSPVSLAAAAVYAAGLLVKDEPHTQETVGEATDVSQVTIRSRYRELLEADDDCPL